MVGIKHSTVKAAYPTPPFRLLAVDWNAEHVVDELSITFPQLAQEIQDLINGALQGSISMTPADHSGIGICTVGTVGETVAMGDVLYMKSDGKFWRADADAAATMPGMLLAMAAITAGNNGNLMHLGYFRDDSWSWTIGELLYVSVTPGNPTQTAPSGTGDQVQVIGTAVSAHVIFFNPSPVLVEVA